MKKDKARMKPYIYFLNWISNTLRTVNLQTRLIISFMLLTITPLTVLGISSYSISYKKIEKDAMSYSTTNLLQTKHNIDYMLSTYLDRLNDLSTNIDLLKNLSEYRSLDKSDMPEAYQRIYYIIKSMTRVSNDLITMEIMDNHGVITFSPYRIMDGELDKSVMYKQLTSSNDRVNWLGTTRFEYQGSTSDTYKNNKSMAMVVSVKLKDLKDGSYIGAINTAISEDAISSIIRDMNMETESNIFVTNANGRIISHSNKELLATYDNPEITRSINEITASKTSPGIGNNGFIKYISGEKYYVAYALSQVTGWRIISLTKYSDLMADINRVNQLTLLIIIICMIFIIPLSIVVTRSVTTPVKKLKDAMNEAERANFSVKIRDESKDEVGFLAQNFDKMILQIRSLITENYDVRIKQKEAEFKALEYQINPHFLYNTLDAINWMAYSAGNKEICTMVNALSKFFRLSLNRGHDQYEIAKEIEHVESYIAIQKARYKDKIDFIIDYSKEVLEYTTIKLLIQPLVENAIYHGIGTNGGRGSVQITIKKIDDKIQYEIRDDGRGIEDIDNIFMLKKQKRLSSGYGIKNINERIKLYYGNEYGLEFENARPHGLIARIWIPATRS